MTHEGTQTMIQTRAVLAGAYRGRGTAVHDGMLLTHALDTDEERVLCGRVLVESLADEYERIDADAAPSCKVCARRDPRQLEPTR